MKPNDVVNQYINCTDRNDEEKEPYKNMVIIDNRL